MTQPDHLTEEQFARYQSRMLPPEELLEVDGHVAHCEVCRQRLYDQEHATTRLQQLKIELSEHLAFDQIAASAQGAASPEAARHLNDCATCRAEVADLVQFRKELTSQPPAPVEISARPFRWRIPVAAAVLLAAGLTAWVLRQQPGPAANPSVAVLPAEAPLSAEHQQLVADVRASHRLERAPLLDRLITHRGALLGSSTSPKSFDLLGPLGTTAVTDRPTFRWKPAEGATQYVVALFDENFRKLAESPALTVTEWQPSQPLERGRIYNWQVNATVGPETVHAPVPPAGEARFQIVSSETSEQLAAARREHRGNHLLLASLYARAGALDEAALELDQVNDPIAADLRQSLIDIRK